MAPADYSKKYYQRIQEGSRRSAREVLPLVLELINPHSAIDVGCGLGTWLAILRSLGVEDVIGIDAHSVDKELLEIPPEQFHTFDLTKKLQLNRTFDLVISMEVAEHLPCESAETFVESLTLLGPVVLFSAAIPHQGGEHHVNEQWPDYWAGLFAARGFVVIDCLRKKLWQNRNVEWWYAQNILLFARRDYLESHPRLREALDSSAAGQLSVVHPSCYLAAADPKKMGLRRVLSALPIAIWNFIRRRLGASAER